MEGVAGRSPESGTLGLSARYGGDAEGSPKETKTFWWEPFWMETSFWDRQMDLPFRKDRRVLPHMAHTGTLRRVY